MPVINHYYSAAQLAKRIITPSNQTGEEKET